MARYYLVKMRKNGKFKKGRLTRSQMNAYKYQGWNILDYYEADW